MSALTRRTFVAGLLAAPAIVRAASMDFIPRGLPLLPQGLVWSSDWSITAVEGKCVVLTHSDCLGVSRRAQASARRHGYEGAVFHNLHLTGDDTGLTISRLASIDVPFRIPQPMRKQ